MGWGTLESIWTWGGGKTIISVWGMLALRPPLRNSRDVKERFRSMSEDRDPSLAGGISETMVFIIRGVPRNRPRDEGMCANYSLRLCSPGAW